ncbi:MAG: ABC transporter ATP-binding protein [Pseudoflavonifractor sp.]|nr:ABC transporter ATP-binding protein [Pseudoflavonifractor sp.]MDY3020401.1 ABC transporter ATP-binding protein [Oscillospiraceae bacterium]
MEEKILEVNDLSVSFSGGVQAVSDVSFDLRRGEAFALVGESGCGKSTTARAILRLIRSPGRITGGQVRFEGRDLLELSSKEMSQVRGREIGMIFQNPLDSLNPVYTIGGQVTEGLVVDRMEKREAWRLAADMFRDVKIPDAEKRMKSYPHEISGGMRQRVMIGMMLCRHPKLLIADEPTTALDVTIQAGIIELMNDLRRKYDTAVLMITHDFGIVADMADRVGVMYAGKLVELGDVYTIFDRPLHPYTRMLMKALPVITKKEGRLATIPGTVPDLSKPVKGCRFADRCPDACGICRGAAPALTECQPGHLCACHKEKGGGAHV